MKDEDREDAREIEKSMADPRPSVPWGKVKSDLLVGKHAFTPHRPLIFAPMQETFSLGIFEWLPKSNGKGVKRGPVKVRVKGRMADSDLVYGTARRIVAQLDAGAYRGRANVRVR